jgi:hypothetical protein
MAEILSFRGERLKRSGTRLLFPIVADHRSHRNVMMRAEHAAG